MVVVWLPLLLHATSNRHPASTRKTTQKPSNFLRFGLFNPAPPSNIAGTSRLIANRVREPRIPAGVVSAACGPVVETVSVDWPTLFVTEITPIEQVGAGTPV